MSEFIYSKFLSKECVSATNLIYAFNCNSNGNDNIKEECAGSGLDVEVSAIICDSEGSRFIKK